MKLLLQTPQCQLPFTVRDNITADDMPHPEDHTVRIERMCKKRVMSVEGKMKVQEGDVVTLTRLTSKYDGESIGISKPRNARHILTKDSRRHDKTTDDMRRRDLF